MRATAEIKGVEETLRRLREYRDVTRDEIRAELHDAALYTQGLVRNAVQSGPATGNVYQKAHPSRTHQASAPGEAPKTDLGGLVRSYHAAMVRDMASAVWSDLPYALYLEEGTTRIDARPHLWPSFKAGIKRLGQRLRLLHDRVARRMGE